MVRTRSCFDSDISAFASTIPIRSTVYVVVVVVVVSHIQHIGCQPEKTTLHGGQSRSWSAEQGKKKKRNSLAAPPPPPLRALLVRRKIKNKNHATHPHGTRRYEGRRYAGGLGPSRVRTRIPTTRRLGQWVSLRKVCVYLLNCT